MKTGLYKALTKTIARVLHTPEYLILFVSDSCWMKCKHCWFNEEWKDRNLTNKDGGVLGSSINDDVDLIKTKAVDYNPLSFDELEKIADSINRISFITITGGEAFMRKDIVDIVTMFFRKAGMRRCQIPTSGYVTDMIVEKTEKILKENPGKPFRTDVSLDGPKDLHESIRGVRDVYERALETIKELNKLKQKYPYFDVGVISTISSANQHRVDEMAKIIEENHSGEWMVNLVRGLPRDPTAIDVDPEMYLRAHKIIANRIENGQYNGHANHRAAPWLSAKNAVRRDIIYKTVKGELEGGGCAAGAISAVMYSDGTVLPCELLEQPEHSMGNIRDFDYDFKTLWNSPKSDEVRDWIQDTKCICTQECFLSTSILIQPQHWPSLVSERIKLLKS